MIRRITARRRRATFSVSGTGSYGTNSSAIWAWLTRSIFPRVG